MEALQAVAAVYLALMLAAVVWLARSNPRRFRRVLMSANVNFWRGLGKGLGWTVAAALALAAWRAWG